jgi:nucleoside-triphosphatase THEP1
MDNIKKWISESYNNKFLSTDSCLLITGNSGVGKTHIIYKIIEDLDLFVINIDINNCSTSEEFIDFIIKSISSSLIQILTNNNKKKIILIDNFDVLLSLDATINIALLKILTKKNNYKHIPIICISSIELIKKIGDIKKKCKIININDPTNDEIFNIISNSYPSMNKHEIFDLITSTETKNINQIFKKIENTNVYYDIDTKYDIYCNNFNRDDLRRIISAESWLIILKFHENLFGDLNNRKIIKKNKNSYYKNYLNNFCYFDYLMTISNEIAIDFFISLIYDIIILKYKKNITINNNNFTKILSYLSLQKKNIKLSYNNNFPLYQIGNYHINIINRKYIYYI